MNPLLNRAFIAAGLTVLSGILTYFHVLPAGAAEHYLGEATTIVFAVATGDYALAARTAAAAVTEAATTSVDK